ncbi:uncharacterized protein LOC111259908 isoform X2 [Varroa jacobsoni]|uniref:uncharacterized protein LOC111259908 isoform X2 n=1 Tax=Varroa jacobsoni TaxID=62625 RepID=UPI000BF3FA5E|nr:uncharacterized protein LOC111259908 isoform X2 [Varroa jacobsoni]
MTPAGHLNDRGNDASSCCQTQASWWPHTIGLATKLPGHGVTRRLGSRFRPTAQAQFVSGEQLGEAEHLLQRSLAREPPPFTIGTAFTLQQQQRPNYKIVIISVHLRELVLWLVLFACPSIRSANTDSTNTATSQHDALSLSCFGVQHYAANLAVVPTTATAAAAIATLWIPDCHSADSSFPCPLPLLLLIFASDMKAQDPATRCLLHVHEFVADARNDNVTLDEAHPLRNPRVL